MKKLILVATAVTLLQGCATIANGGGDQAISFASEPAGATILVNEREVGTTPATLTLNPWNAERLTIKKEGHKEYTAPMTLSTSGWFWGNLLIGGIVGMLVDSVTGASQQFDEKHHNVKLEPTDSLAESAPKTPLIASAKPKAVKRTKPNN